MSTFSLVQVSGRPLRSFVALAFAGVAFLSSGSTSASPEFPGVVQETLKMDCAPPCTICHTSPNGEAVTAVQPFVETLRTADAAFMNSEEALANALEIAKTAPCEGTNQPCDSDGNGTSDIDDLTAGNDPNTGQPLACPKYGCGAHIAPERPLRNMDGTIALLALGALGIVARRVRRS
jgi:hypothetical protein